jgi:uncharacterized damage-inducible protein DinB
MNKADLQHLLDYLYWVNGRLLDAAKDLDSGELTRSSPPTTRDLRATLVHELDVEWSWRLNLQGRLTDAEQELRPADYPDIATLREHWARDEAEMRTWLAGLTEDDLAAAVQSDLTKNRLPLWQGLLHIIFHGMQQQADAATLLTLAGHSPGDIGYLEMLRRKIEPGAQAGPSPM